MSGLVRADMVTTLMLSPVQVRLSARRSTHARLLCVVLVMSLSCASLSQSVSAAWPHVVRYGPLVVHADFDPRPLAGLFTEIVTLQSDLQAQLEIAAPAEHIDVYLFARQATYHAYMRRYFPHVVPRQAMFIKSNSPGNVFAHASSDFDVDLRHECTHALLHAALPMVPLWLDEGLAEYFELPKPLRVAGNPYFSAVKRNSYWRRPTAIESLETIRGLEEMGSTEYRDAWSWVHFMLHGPPAARQELTEFLREIENHTPPTALSRRLRASIPGLTDQYLAHFRKWHR